MTHEIIAGDGRVSGARSEPPGGPEKDPRLPDAAGVPVYESPEDSFAPKLTEDIDDTGSGVLRPVQSFWTED